MKHTSAGGWLMVVAVCWFSSLQANTIIVSPGQSIREAVNKSQPFDTIVIRNGLYHEHGIEIHKPLYLTGEDHPVIDAGGNGEIINIFSDSVHIEGLHFRGVNVSFLKELAAIRINHAAHITLKNNNITDCFFGIYIQYGKHCILENNYIKGSIADEARAGNAIHVWKAENITVTNNNTAGHRDGIYFEFVDSSMIANNKSYNNLRYGLHFMFSNDDVYHDNLFKSNGAGVAVMFSKRIKMDHNTFEENQGSSSYGLLLKEISRGELSNNLFKRNTIGIYAEGATAIKIYHNDFESNGKAIDIKGNCIDNEIKYNNFFSNTFEVYTNTKSNLNQYDNNYWSQYNGYDLDKDGIGDEPYRPVNLMASITNEIPAACILLHSFLATSIDMMEKNFPELIPETLVDPHPSLMPIHHD